MHQSRSDGGSDLPCHSMTKFLISSSTNLVSSKISYSPPSISILKMSILLPVKRGKISTTSISKVPSTELVRVDDEVLFVRRIFRVDAPAATGRRSTRPL